MPAKAKYRLRPDGRYETSRTDPRTGKKVHFYGRTPKDIDRQIMEYATRREQGRTFRAVAEEWHDQHWPTLARNTLRGYNPAYARAIVGFGSRPIREIKPRDIKAFISDFAHGGRARKTVATQLQMLNMICSYAVGTGDIDFSPCDHISVPKNLPKGHRDAASPEDEERIKATKGGVWLLPYLLYYTGLRKGEALALRYEDFDFKAKTISVTKSVYHENNTPQLKEPKTEAGARSVPILAPLYAAMPRRWHGYLFSSDGGETPLTERCYNRLWREYAQKTGITATAHQLRHSFATLLFECGLDVKDCQDLLGHSTAAMTQDIYTHLRNARREQTASQLDELVAEREAAM